MEHCKWYHDEFCTNDKSPCVADYCPVVQYPELCKYREQESSDAIRKNVEYIVKNRKKMDLHSFIGVCEKGTVHVSVDEDKEIFITYNAYAGGRQEFETKSIDEAVNKLVELKLNAKTIEI